MCVRDALGQRAEAEWFDAFDRVLTLEEQEKISMWAVEMVLGAKEATEIIRKRLGKGGGIPDKQVL